MVAKGGVVEDLCERSGTKWGGQISPSTAPLESESSYLEVDMLQNLQIWNN
jgi:hypothetical protein